jgi:AcrR family transcriptional regulator
MDEAAPTVRDRVSSSRDVRAERTRAKLIAAFDELSLTGESLSVANIVQLSGVNRTTFYSHYAGVDELAVQALGELFDAVAVLDVTGRGHGHDTETSRQSLREVATFIGERRSSYTTLLERNAFLLAVEDAFTERNRQTLARMRTVPPHVDHEVAARFVAAGALGTIAQWLRTGAVEDAAVIAARIVDVLPAWFVDGD